MIPTVDPARLRLLLLPRASSRRRLAIALVSSILLGGSAAARAAGDIPSFSATALTGTPMTAADLLGRPMVLILTPSRGAAADTREWALSLRRALGDDARVRDIIAVDLPFFMSEADAIGRAREKIPVRYHDQTWLMSSTTLELALGVPPDSHDAFIFVLDIHGRVMTRASGQPTKAKVDQVRSALESLR